MPIFKPINENEATGKVKKVFDEIKSVRKITEVPNFWKYIANSPETLERTWNSTSQVIKYNNHVELQQSRVTASLENCAMSTPNNHHLKLNLCLD